MKGIAGLVMSELRRYFKAGDSVFLTSVTLSRRPILTLYSNLFLEAMHYAIDRSHCTNVAWVVLSDHFHIILTIQAESPSETLRRLKLSFSRKFRKHSGHCGRVWQYRFWDHIIRDQDDLNHHIDYIHYNPVKHGIVRRPLDYSLSTFQSYVDRGLYSPLWGTTEIVALGEDYGE